MLCDNRFCVYWERDQCALEEISVDCLGRCEACILVNVKEKVLYKARGSILRRYEKDESAWPEWEYACKEISKVFDDM